MSAPLIEINNLRKSFNLGGGATLHAVNDISFSIKKEKRSA